MKWFKHETDSMDSEKMKMIIYEFGFEGYGWFWRIMEIIAKQMDETNRCHYEQPVSEWCGNLKVKQRKLRKFLELTTLQTITKVVYSGDKLRIKIPNLLKKRDNYTKHLQVADNKNVKKFPLDVDVDVDVEVDKKPMKKAKKKNPSSAEKKTSASEHTDTYKAEQFWISEYQKVYQKKPTMTQAKDRSLLKELIKHQGFDEVMRKIPLHIESGSLLSIGGLQTKFNDLGIAKKKTFETFDERHEREMAETKERLNASHN